MMHPEMRGQRRCHTACANRGSCWRSLCVSAPNREPTSKRRRLLSDAGHVTKRGRRMSTSPDNSQSFCSCVSALRRKMRADAPMTAAREDKGEGWRSALVIRPDTWPSVKVRHLILHHSRLCTCGIRTVSSAS
ncbi:hypothetical protein CCMA1212_002938 [Trichoderma ghanense]|uniref:Uncharacterized protein n=1 Tax=Trichoderma ghanense TaxID=65468 RepID=A0ABY2HCF6_9HYPO